MSEHTPEPWHYCGEDRGGCKCMMIWGDDHPIAQGVIGDWGDIDESGEMTPYGDIPEDEAKANIARIVACVNECKGINPKAVPKLMAACRTLNAATKATNISDMWNSLDIARDLARAAIAKAQEK